MHTTDEFKLEFPVGSSAGPGDAAVQSSPLFNLDHAGMDGRPVETLMHCERGNGEVLSCLLEITFIYYKFATANMF